MRKAILLLGVLLALPAFAAAQPGRLNVAILSCTNLTCEIQKDAFFLDEQAYIDYNASMTGISYAATLTFPDGTSYQTQFPNRITSNVSGNYTVEMTVWMEGYDDINVTKIVQFVDRPSAGQAQNPPAIDWVWVLIPLAAVLTAFVGWRVYTHRKPKDSAQKKVG